MSRSRSWKVREPRRTAPVAAVLAQPAAPAAPARRRTSLLRHPTIGWLAATGVATLAGLGVVLGLVRLGDAVPDDPGPPAVAPAPAYRAVYRVDDTAGAAPLVQTDVISVRRPGQVRVEHRDGAPPGGAVVSGSVVNRTERVTLPEGFKAFATPLTLALEPQVFSRPALSAAVAAGVAEERGGRSVLGQRCTTYLYRHSGSEALRPGDAQEHVESCVTPDGIMLREAVSVAGRQVRVAEATAVDRAPRFGPDEFATPGEIAATVSATERVTEGRPSGAALHATAPAGLRRDRQLTDARQEGDAPLMPFYLDSFTGGGEFAVVQQLMLRQTAISPWSADGGSRVALGDGRSGDVLYHTGFVEVQTTVGGFPVRVLASRLELALRMAGTLRA